MSHSIYFCVLIRIGVIISAVKWPGECDPEQFYDPGLMVCQNCPANVSMVASAEGFGCTCEDHSVPAGPSRCRPCNATEVVSEDGSACVPRRCQISAGKIVCRKCPNDYISVTQGFDGSTLKEVLCVKCARGFKPQDNKCVKCEACTCNRNEIIVRGACVPKRYVNDRPKYLETNLHPTMLLEVVKQEYLCTKYDLRSCRTLARMCVTSFYMADTAGPCRLWLQTQLVTHKGLPQLTLPSTSRNTNTEDIELAAGQKTLDLAMVIHIRTGGLKLLRVGENISPCLPPLDVRIGWDVVRQCQINVSNTDVNVDDVYELYLYHNGDFKPIPLSILKPTGYYVQKGVWSSGRFKKFFTLHSSLSTTSNVTDVVYLKSFTLLNKIERNKHSASSLHIELSVVLQYATKTPFTDTVATTLKIVHDMPRAGVFRGLEIWGGIFGTLSTLYAVVQWRGVVRRGGLQVAVVPLLAGAVADALYFAALLSTVYALSAEVGSLGMTLPLSKGEETVIEAFVYTVLALKILKVLWINWCQCHCDVFFIDWSQYNPPLKGPSVKDAWLKLRNCHRDAIRRRNKLYKAGSVTKIWKYEKQMEFLIYYMTNKPMTEDNSTEDSSHYELTQPEELLAYPEVKFEAATQHSDPLLMEISNHVLSPSGPANNMTDISVAHSPLAFLNRSQMPSNVTDLRGRESTSNEFDLNTLITRTLNNHEKRAKEKEKRAIKRDNEDDLQQFFNTIYTITKKMPALSQHKLKKRIFNLVSDEEEYLLNLRANTGILSIPPSNQSDPATPMSECSEPLS